MNVETTRLSSGPSRHWRTLWNLASKAQGLNVPAIKCRLHRNWTTRGVEVRAEWRDITKAKLWCIITDAEGPALHQGRLSVFSGCQQGRLFIAVV